MFPHLALSTSTLINSIHFVIVIAYQKEFALHYKLLNMMSKVALFILFFKLTQNYEFFLRGIMKHPSSSFDYIMAPDGLKKWVKLSRNLLNLVQIFLCTLGQLCVF